MGRISNFIVLMFVFTVCAYGQSLPVQHIPLFEEASHELQDATPQYLAEQEIEGIVQITEGAVRLIHISETYGFDDRIVDQIYLDALDEVRELSEDLAATCINNPEKQKNILQAVVALEDRAPLAIPILEAMEEGFSYTRRYQAETASAGAVSRLYDRLRRQTWVPTEKNLLGAYSDWILRRYRTAVDELREVRDRETFERTRKRLHGHIEVWRFVASLFGQRDQDNSAEQAMNKGFSAFNSGRYSEAIDWFNQALAIDAEYSMQRGAHYYSGRCHRELRRFNEALQSFRKSVYGEPMPWRSRAYSEILAVFESDYEESEATYLEEIRFLNGMLGAPPSGWPELQNTIRYDIGRIYERHLALLAESDDLKEQYYLKAVESFVDYEAHYYPQESGFHPAYILFRAASILKNQTFWLNIATNRKINHCLRALEIYQRILLKYPEESEIPATSYEVGDMQYLRGDVYYHRLASDTLDTSITEKERYLLAAFVEYRLFRDRYASEHTYYKRESGWWKMASCYSRIATLHPSWTKREYYLKKALTEYRALLSAYPTHSAPDGYNPARCQLSIANTLYLLGLKFENGVFIEYLRRPMLEAAEEFRRHINNYPDEPESVRVISQLFLAHSLFGASEYEQAIDEYQVVLSDYSDLSGHYLPSAIFQQGNCYYHLERYPAAQERFMKIIREYPAWRENAASFLKMLLLLNIESSEGGIITAGRQGTHIILDASVVYPDGEPAQISANFEWNWEIDGDIPPGASLSFQGSRATYIPDIEKTEIIIKAKVKFNALDARTSYDIELSGEITLFGGEDRLEILDQNGNKIEWDNIIDYSDDTQLQVELVLSSDKLQSEEKIVELWWKDSGKKTGDILSLKLTKNRNTGKYTGDFILGDIPGLKDAVENTAKKSLTICEIGGGDSDTQYLKNIFVNNGWTIHGYANRHSKESKYNSKNANITPDVNYLAKAGALTLCARYQLEQSELVDHILINSKVNWLVHSGHGLHLQNRLVNFYDRGSWNGLFTPDNVGLDWTNNLDFALFLACSVLDINNYNKNWPWYKRGPHYRHSPGREWYKKVEKNKITFIGSNYLSPPPVQSKLLLQEFVRLLNGKFSDESVLIKAWLDAGAKRYDLGGWRDRFVGTNNCAIAKDGSYHYLARSGVLLWRKWTPSKKTKKEWKKDYLELQRSLQEDVIPKTVNMEDLSAELTSLDRFSTSRDIISVIQDIFDDFGSLQYDEQRRLLEDIDSTRLDEENRLFLKGLLYNNPEFLVNAEEIDRNAESINDEACLLLEQFVDTYGSEHYLSPIVMLAIGLNKEKTDPEEAIRIYTEITENPMLLPDYRAIALLGRAFVFEDMGAMTNAQNDLNSARSLASNEDIIDFIDICLDTYRQ